MGTEDEPEGDGATTTTDVERVEDRFRGGAGESAAAAQAAGHVGGVSVLRQAAPVKEEEEEGGAAVRQIEQGRVAGDETRKDASSGEGDGEGTR